MSRQVTTLRNIALSLPQAEEGTSCNKAAFKAGNKNFLFVGEEDGAWDAKLKLDESIQEASDLAKKSPENYGVGGTGWVTLEFPDSKGPPRKLLERWVKESFRLLVPKRIAAELES